LLGGERGKAFIPARTSEPHIAAWGVRRDNGAAGALRGLNHLAVPIGVVAGRAARRLAELLLVDEAGEVIVDVDLRVPLDELEAERGAVGAGQHALPERGRERQAERVPVRLADHHGVRVRRGGDQFLPVGTLPRVAAIEGDGVARIDRGRRRRTLGRAGARTQQDREGDQDEQSGKAARLAHGQSMAGESPAVNRRRRRGDTVAPCPPD